MLTVTDDYTASLPYPFEKLDQGGGLLFFDIETTGLSAKTSLLYLIGSLYTDGTSFHLIQWFSEGEEDEKKLLLAFREYVGSLPAGCRLLHFNGNTFDLPYLRQKYARYKCAFPLDEMDSADLLRLIRPYRRVMGLASLRQKALEDYLGIEREDPFSGGQLISVYQDYLQTRSPAGLKALLLHNDEDLRNMPRLLAALNLRDYMQADYTLSSWRVHGTRSLDGCAREELMVVLESPVSLPRPISLRQECGPYLTASDRRISLAVPLVEQELKHYFPNPKDYYYLPSEDRAVHKSVGVFVDPAFRQKATKDTCYVRKEGCFLPCPAGMKMESLPAGEKEGTESLLTRSLYRADLKAGNWYLEWTGEEAPPWKACPDAFWSESVRCIWKRAG